VSIAKILVPATGTPRDEAAISAAIQIAKLCTAHVQVQFVHPDPANAIPMVGMPLSGDVMQAIIDGQTKFAQAAAARARQTLSDVCGRESVSIVDHPEQHDSATCSFRQFWGNADRLIVDAAKLSDLVVFGPIHWRDSPEMNEAFLDVLRSVRRPVLVANGLAGGRLRKVAVGWDGSVFAAHAICAALPILQRAEQVLLIVVRRAHTLPVPTQELKDYLARNGINYMLRMIDASSIPPADTLVTEAAVADMLVVGGYGHDHLWETVFGGVTAKILADTKIPVLIAH
jgi:nucleotide-binding universal stress UspA family protein